MNINFEQLSKREKTYLYINNMTSVLNQSALFSDGTEEYRSPAEPMPYDKVKIRFRTARDNVDFVYLVTNTEKINMEKCYDDRLFDYYEIELELTDQKIEYYFEIQSGRAVCYYNSKGVFRDIQPCYNFFIKTRIYYTKLGKGSSILSNLCGSFL